MDYNILTYLACICFLFLFGRIFIVPIKKVLKLVVNSILGGAIIYIINLIGNSFNFHIGLNFFTSILIGILGIQGAAVLVIFLLPFLSCFSLTFSLFSLIITCNDNCNCISARFFYFTGLTAEMVFARKGTALCKRRF